MGIHNSSSYPIDQRVANLITEKPKKIMKAFTTACALIAGSASADSHFYNQGLVYPAQAAYPAQVYGVHAPFNYIPQQAVGGYYFNHPAMAGHPLFKREAEAEFSYQSKVTHPEEQAAYEFKVNVDQMGNGKSYQHHEQLDNHRQQQYNMENQMDRRMDGHRNQMAQQMDSRMQYNMDNQMDRRMNEQRMNQMDRRMDGRMQYNMDNRVNQMDEMSREGDMFDRMMEQRQDGNMRDYMTRRRQHDGRNNMYSYERMLQRQNEAARRMNNQEQRRMFKREAEGAFEYDVMAEHSADNSQRQMIDMVARPQHTYRMNQMDNRMDSRMNQMNRRMNMNQYNMDNHMNNQMNKNQFNKDNRMNQMDNHRNQYNMDGRMNQNEMMNNRYDSRMNNNQMMNNRFDSRMNQNNNRFDSRMQYNMDNRMNNMEHRQMERQNMGFDRASMQYFPNQFQHQQEQMRNYF